MTKNQNSVGPVYSAQMKQKQNSLVIQLITIGDRRVVRMILRTPYPQRSTEVALYILEENLLPLTKKMDISPKNTAKITQLVSKKEADWPSQSVDLNL